MENDMGFEKLKTAVLGLGDQGREALAIAAESEYFQICAVADSDAELAEKIARTHECGHYFDYRQLVIQNDLDILIACEPTYVCAEFIRLAMSKQCNVIKMSPAALNFEQAYELFDIAKKNKVQLAAASPVLFSDGLMQLAKFIETEGKDSFHLITATYNTEGTISEPQNRWLTDPSLAGGGVLLHDCYPFMQQLISSFGIPEKIYALTGNNAPDRQQRLATTEDTVVVTMHYSDIQMAQINASRTFGPYEQYIRIHAKDSFLTANTNGFTQTGNDGKVISHRSYNTTSLDWKKEMLDSFARGIFDPAKISSKFTNDLHTMAVIQSAYLSAKTSMPEEPARMLERVKT